MLYFTKHEKDCTGCSACYAACPVQCISMEPNTEGFLYPVASDRCIHCGKCERVCPVQVGVKEEKLMPKVAVVAVSKDKNIWQRSASGGAFSDICYAWGDSETLVVGAAFDGLKVHHVCIKGVENIAPLCKSKYVASNVENTFVQIKDALMVGQKVIFCGTPCQVAGLNAYLNKKYENLLTIDLICHGVGSPAAFEASVRVMEKKLGKKISAYQFRAKRKTYYVDHLSKVTFENDKQETYLLNDPYIQLFLSQRILRTSCANPCVFRSDNRPGDLTIADFKGVEHIFPEWEGTKRNYSSVVANTEKGLAVVQRLDERMHVFAGTIEDVKRYNPLFSGQTYFPKDRDEFLADFRENPEHAVEKWTEQMQVDNPSFKRKLFDAAPVFVRKWVPRLLKKRKV